MSKLTDTLQVPANTPLIEAVSNHDDPVFSRSIAVPVTKKDIADGKRGDHLHCAIAVAVRNSYPDILSVWINSRRAYVARFYPRRGVNEALRGKLVIEKRQLSAQGARLVQAFDKNPNKAPSGLVEILPIAPSHTAEAYAQHYKRGYTITGRKNQKHKIGKDARPTFLRPRLALPA